MESAKKILDRIIEWVCAVSYTHLSVWVAAGWVQLTAFITCVVIWMFTGREPVAGIMQVTPKYVLVGGIMGALITLSLIHI